MALDDLHLLPGQPARLVEDVVRDADLADVVQCRAKPQRVEVGRRQAKALSQGQRVGHDPLRVALRERAFGVHDPGHGEEHVLRAVELVHEVLDAEQRLAPRQDFLRLERFAEEIVGSEFPGLQPRLLRRLPG